MGHVAPWWSHYFADHFLRRFIHPPRRLLGPHLAEGMTALDLGCGMGVFTLSMAEMVGPAGCVLAVDLSGRSLDVLARRAGRAGLADRIVVHRSTADDIGLADRSGTVDFALAFWMVHEVPDVPRFMAEVRRLLKPGARLLLTEPIRHVSAGWFETEIEAAEAVGLSLRERPRVRWSRAALVEAVGAGTDRSSGAGGCGTR